MPAPDQQTGAPPSLQSLTASYGPSVALALWKLFAPETSGAGRGLAAGRLGSDALQVLGRRAGDTELLGLGKNLGYATTAAGTGYDLSQIAKNPRMSLSQKFGAGFETGGNAAIGLAVPYGGEALLAKALVGMLQQSGSPQVSALGRGLANPARPVEGLLDVVSGRRSIPGAFRNMGRQLRQTPVMGDLAGMLGIGTKPTTGTTFRGGLDQVFAKLGLPQFNRADKSLYNIDPAKWNALAPSEQQAAAWLGQTLGQYAPGYKSNPTAYGNQASAILANQYGGNLSQLEAGVRKKLGIK